MSTETNPYQSPETFSERVAPVKQRVWWRILTGILLILLGIPIVLYGLLICYLIFQSNFATPPVPPFVILGCGLLITGLGVSLGSLGIGVWRASGRWFLSGLLGMLVCVLSYIALVVTYA